MTSPLELPPAELARLLERLGPVERRRATELARQAQRALEGNPLWRFNADGGVRHPKQEHWLTWGGPGTTKLFIGGNRSGKTTGGVVDDIVQAVDRSAVPPHLQRVKKWEPPFFGRVVTPDFKNSHQVLLDKFRAWVPRDQLRAGRFDRALSSQDGRRLWFRNGSWIEFMSQEQDLDAFAAQALHRVHFDEEPLYEAGMRIFNECQARLMDFDGDTLITMTPLLGMSWVYDKLYLPWERGGTEDTLVVSVSIHDNPHNNERGVQRFLTKLATLSKEEREARQYGRFVAFEGLIYPEFDPLGEHVLPQLEQLPARENRRCVLTCIDPGLREVDGGGTGVIFLCQQPDGTVDIFDELKVAGQPVPEVCRLILEREAYWKVQPDWRVIDPMAKARTLENARRLQGEFAEHGVSCQYGQNDVTTGISRVKALLQKQPDPAGGALRPSRLRIRANCSELIEEFRRYRWTSPKRSEHAPREQPVKRFDHLLDALRYGVMSLPALPEAPVVDNRTVQERMAQADFEQMMDSMQGRGVQESTYGPGFFG